MNTTRRAAFAATLFAAAALGTVTAGAQSGPRVGAAAPAFTSVDSNGKPVSLADLKGKTVVLEWTNDECPFVRKHYTGQNMQALQKKWTDKGVVWLSVISSVPGEQGFADSAKANKLTVDRGAAPLSAVSLLALAASANPCSPGADDRIVSHVTPRSVHFFCNACIAWPP